MALESREGLDMSDGPRMGWYDSSWVRGGQNFQVDAKAEIKWVYSSQWVTTQRQKSFDIESHFSSTLMCVKLVKLYHIEQTGH